MALEVSLSVLESEDCQSWDVVDTAGTYSAVAPINLTGYDTPNLASADVIKATILVIQYGQTTGYTFTFTIATNVITAATLTDPNGDITIITADLTYTTFPFTTAAPFVLIADWLGFGTDSEFESDAYYLEYNVTADNITVYTGSSDELIVCATCCCVRGMAADLDDCSCENKDNALDNAVKAQIFLDSAIWSMGNGEVDKSVVNLNTAKTLCTGGCEGC